MKRVAALLVQPKTPQTFWSLDSTVKAVGFKAVMPPLGLMTIASMLPPHFDVKLVDMNTTELLASDIEHADIVFLTGMWVHQESFVQVVRMCHELKTTIVAGGPLVQSWYGAQKDNADDHMDFDKIDHLVIYEAEVNLPKFLEDYAQNKAERIYANRERPDLSLTPTPRFDLINPMDYASMALQFSRGCPFNCEFCDIIQMFGRVPRTKSPEQFIGEMDRLYATGSRGHLFVVDDNFIANRKVVKELLRRIVTWQQERQYPYILFTEASVDLAADDELLQLMAQAGFTSVFLGIESPDPVTLRAANKKQNVRCNLDESVLKIQKAGIEVMAGFILGFDTDSPDVFDSQLDFIRRNGIAQSMVGVLTALPNTDLYKRLGREGRLIQLGKNHTGDNVNACLNFVPKMPEETLLNGYTRVISESYSAEKYFERSLTLISRLPNLRLSSLFGPDSWQRSMARSRRLNTRPSFKLSLRMTGQMMKVFASRWGIHALPFLFKSLGYGIFAFPVAAELVFRGRHYAEVAERIVAARAAALPAAAA